MKTHFLPRSILAGFLVLIALIFAGCSVVTNSDGQKRKVVTPLKIVPDGDYEELAANIASPWTGAQSVSALGGGLQVKDGRAIAGGYTGTVSTPFGVSGGFTVKLRSPTTEPLPPPSTDEPKPKTEPEPPPPVPPPDRQPEPLE